MECFRSKSAFSAREICGDLNIEALLDLLRDQVPALICRGAVNVSRCTAAAAAFLASPKAQLRSDNVPARSLGAFHYGKPLMDYLDSVRSSESDVTWLVNLAGMGSIRHRLRNSLKQRGFRFRSARHGNDLGGAYVFRSWQADGAYSLRPHEDLAQLSDPKQAGFEIQRCTHVAALNVCLQNERGGGRVRLWNVQPTVEDRTRLGLDHTGHSYPAEFLDSCEHIDLMVDSGDIFVINSSFVHAVTTPAQGAARVTAAFFIGLLDDRTIISWT